MLYYDFSLFRHSKPSPLPDDDISVALLTAKELGLSNIITAVQILATLPVTSCEAERSFSKLGYLKDDLRTTMGHDRLDFLFSYN